MGLLARLWRSGAERPRIGKYRVIRRLAQGGMGEIFLACAVGRKGFEKVVVLKRILRHNLADREAVRMFLDEARLQATLDHPNIVQVHDFGTAGGSHFFAMEYVHGADLGRIIAGAPMLSLEFAMGVIAEAAAGLHYAHEKRGRDGAPLQIVHRDISPSNVLVSYGGAVKVTDFGIAKWSRRETETRYGALRGKIAYMSPEQCRGLPVDRRSDVFGLGILLYELVTGTRLYQGTSDFAILERIVKEDAPPLSSRRPGCPAALDEIARRALARDPNARFPSAAALQAALEEMALASRMKITAAARAQEMEALFGPQVGAWRQAAQAGRSLGDHLASLGDEGARSGDLSGVERGRPTGTLGEGAEVVTRAPAAVRAPRQGPRLVALGIAAAVAVGTAVVVLRPGVSPAPTPMVPPVSTAPAPPPAAVKAEPVPEARASAPARAAQPAGAPIAAAEVGEGRRRKPIASIRKRRRAAVPLSEARAPAPTQGNPDSIFLPR